MPSRVATAPRRNTFARGTTACELTVDYGAARGDLAALIGEEWYR